MYKYNGLMIDIFFKLPILSNFSHEILQPIFVNVHVFLW